ncbi:smalltalk protein [Mediterranea massiliensis]|nr:smalltalk protein [Mediterranea massiliensis]MDM8338680.1 smalltalk protein [Mediterranea massiliensis]
MKINKNLWDTILKVAIAVLSAIAGALGVNAMN